MFMQWNTKTHRESSDACQIPMHIISFTHSIRKNTNKHFPDIQDSVFQIVIQAIKLCMVATCDGQPLYRTTRPTRQESRLLAQDLWSSFC